MPNDNGKFSIARFHTGTGTGTTNWSKDREFTVQYVGLVIEGSYGGNYLVHVEIYGVIEMILNVEVWRHPTLPLLMEVLSGTVPLVGTSHIDSRLI